MFVSGSKSILQNYLFGKAGIHTSKLAIDRILCDFEQSFWQHCVNLFIIKEVAFSNTFTHRICSNLYTLAHIWLNLLFRAHYKHGSKGMIEMKQVSVDSDYCNSWMKTKNRGDSNIQSTLMSHSGTNPKQQKFYIMDQDYVNSSTLQAWEFVHQQFSV